MNAALGEVRCGWDAAGSGVHGRKAACGGIVMMEMGKWMGMGRGRGEEVGVWRSGALYHVLVLCIALPSCAKAVQMVRRFRERYCPVVAAKRLCMATSGAESARAMPRVSDVMLHQCFCRYVQRAV